MLNYLCMYVQSEIEGMIQRSASKHVPDKSNKFCGEEHLITGSFPKLHCISERGSTSPFSQGFWW